MSQPVALIALRIRFSHRVDRGPHRAKHYRDAAAHLRWLAEIEPLAALRRHLRRLAVHHDELAAGLEIPTDRENEKLETARC